MQTLIITIFIGVTEATVSTWESANRSSRGNVSLEVVGADQDALMEINRRKARLLVPVIVYTVVLMVIGAAGNLISIYIYGWNWQSTTTRIFLCSLAVMDLINCIITMPTEIYIMTNFYYFPNAGICRMSRFTTYVINNASAAVFIALAIDRYVRICHPHRKTIRILDAKIACIMSSCVGIAVSWPALVLYGSKRVPMPMPNTKRGYIYGVICDVKNEMDGTPFPFAFFIYLWCAFIICALILSFLYVFIGQVMLRRNKRKNTRPRTKPSWTDHNGDGASVTKDPTYEFSAARPEHSGNNKYTNPFSNWRQSRTRTPRSTLMLFAITAVFIISFLPFLIIMTIRQHFGPLFYPSLSPLQQVIVNLLSRSYLVNNCANPIVYGMCNSQFRNKVKQLFHISAKARNSSYSRDESKLSRRLTFGQ